MSAPATTTNPSRVADIAKAIYAATSTITGDDEAVREAQQGVVDASQAKQAGRIGILVTLGGLSAQGKWTDAEVGLAVTQAIGKANSPESKKALQTFAADIKAAMHPNVRDRVASIHALCEQVWSAEAETDKDTPKPCRKAFQRQYHMLKSALVGAKDGTVVLHGPSDVVFWATQNDPDFNAGKVMKRLASIAAEIAVFQANFPVSHFEGITGFLGEISEDALKAARSEQLVKQEDLTASHTLAPVVTPTTVVNASVDETPVEEDEVEDEVEAEVAHDPIEDYLNGLAA